MRKSVIIGLLLLTAGLFGVATTLNIIISHAMAQGYEDNYYGDDSYSSYPTENKKYECRTGPFEGFFVSSVEFCKHGKFDNKDRKDIRDNRTGTQGPPGPQGPPGANGTQGIQGIQGIQGPIGPNGIQGLSGITTLNDTNLYFVEGNVTTEGDVFSSSIAFCDIGDVVFDGGFRVGDDRKVGGSSFFILYDGPLPPTGSTVDSGYKVEFYSPSSSTGEYEVFAYCFDNPPPH
jgi:hypothetical protein